MSCEHYPKIISFGRKHLCMRIFHGNKDSRSQDQNKKEIHFISHAIKTNVNRFFFMAKQNFILGLMQTPSKIQRNFQRRFSCVVLYFTFIKQFIALGSSQRLGDNRCFFKLQRVELNGAYRNFNQLVSSLFLSVRVQNSMIQCWAKIWIQIPCFSTVCRHVNKKTQYFRKFWYVLTFFKVVGKNEQETKQNFCCLWFR